VPKLFNNYCYFHRNALKKRKLREKKALLEGRQPGINGRPTFVDDESKDIILKSILEDADNGIFHDIKWLEEIVYIFIF
jgi:hypothetical protein